MRTPPLTPLAILLLGGGCLVASPPPPGESSSTGEVRVDEPLHTTADGTPTGSALDRHPALGAPSDDPLVACRELTIDNTISWTCGPDRVLLVQHEGPIPGRARQEFTAFEGGEPEVVEVPVALGERSLTGRGIINPRIDEGPRMFTLLVEDPESLRVASCVTLLAKDDPEDEVRAWCARAVGAALEAGER